MKMKLCALGLISLCLLGCANTTTTPPSPPPPIIEHICNTPEPCRLRASEPRTNGDLNLSLEAARADWAQCAAKIDAIIRCHHQHQGHPDG